MKSDSVKKGMQTAPQRSLFNALGLTKEMCIRDRCKRKLRCYFVAITPWIHERSVKG